MNVVPVLLAGGIGERFWPLSRSSMPKQLLPLVSRRSMLAETLLRVRPLIKKTVRPLIVTGAAMAPKIKASLPRTALCDIIAEPVGKNTAAAIAAAAAFIRSKYGDSVMIVLPADHAISPREEFLAAVRFAVDLAIRQDRLVVFGIRPLRPDTGYGYVKTGAPIAAAGGVKSYVVDRFVEKPDRATAAHYVKSGRFLWNSGMFVWKVSVIQEQFAAFMPALHAHMLDLERHGCSLRAIDAFYARCDKQSIDYGIMERAKNVAAVCGSFRWDDIGSWESMGRINTPDARGTVAIGRRIFNAECDGSIIVNKSGLAVSVVGLSNTVVVATDDALFVIPRDKLPRMKEYLTAMKNNRAFPAKLF